MKWTDRVGYGNVRDAKGKLSLGVSDVNIPETHQPTGIEHPSILKLEFRPNPGRHVIVQTVQPEPNDEFFKEVAKQVSASEGKDAFVFVHGFGLSFESAVRRTAGTLWLLLAANRPKISHCSAHFSSAACACSGCSPNSLAVVSWK